MYLYTIINFSLIDLIHCVSGFMTGKYHLKISHSLNFMITAQNQGVVY